jgi:major membrane immunogen (membrane-anchored lipoprotein)
VIFNNGTFPREPQDFTDKTKAGLMLDAFDGKITKTMFCFTFLKTENRAVCDCVGDEYLRIAIKKSI